MIKLFRLMFGTVLATLGCGAFWHNKPARWHGDEKEDDREQAVEFEGLLPKRKTRDPIKKANDNNPKCDEQQAGIERTEERQQMNTESDREAGLPIALSALMIVSGILAIILPRASGILVMALIGWLLLLSGAAHAAYAWQSGGGYWWGIVLGIIQMLAGGYALVYPGASLASLTLVLAACLVVESILEFILSYLLRLFVVESGWLLLDGIVTLVLGIIMWRTWSGGTLGLIATLLGISMLFSGVTRLMISLAWRSLTKNASG